MWRVAFSTGAAGLWIRPGEVGDEGAGRQLARKQADEEAGGSGTRGLFFVVF